MKLPGFTADAAINDTSAMYGMTAAPEAAGTGALVVPQASLCTTVLNRCLGPVCVRVQLCALPPSACIRVTVAGVTVINRCFP
jgi:hypothetical protein